MPTANSSRAGQGAPSFCSPAGPRQAPHRDPLSPALQQGQGSGLGQADGSVARFDPQPCVWLQLMAFPGCSEVPGVGTRAESPDKCLRLLSGRGVSVLSLWSWAPAGQPHPRVYFGLSAWSFWVSSAGSSPCAADLSFTKKKKKKKARPITGCASGVKFFAHQGRALWCPPPPPRHLLLLVPSLSSSSQPTVTSSQAAQAEGCLLTRVS